MRPEDIEDLERNAQDLATFGYEMGFMEACNIFEEVAKDAPEGATRQNALFFASLLRDAMPKMMENARSNFNFRVVREDADGNAHLEIVYDD